MNSMKRLLTKLVVAILVVAGVVVFSPSVMAAPVDVFNNGACSGNKICQNDGAGVWNIIKNIINILITIGGIVAVIMIVIGGITYTTSGGDGTQTKRAKDTIIYAVVGLVVAVMAYGIVNWVLGRL